jgi:simple sugar transport system ATP-binding protein
MEVEFKNISKRFGTVQALTNVNLTARQGTIHGLIGENGAGKSTLMKILTGYQTKSGGDIYIDGNDINLKTPGDASKIGIGMLYQEPMDFPPLTVLENFSLGSPALPKDAFKHSLQHLTAAFGFQLDPGRRVEMLTVGERQQIELLRLIHCKTKVLILDEPTTGISPAQKELLFPALKKLASEGMTILLVSHKLEEVASLCDEVSVLRHGKVTHHTKAPFHFPELLQAMFGNVPEQQEKQTPRKTGQAIVSMHSILTGGERQGLTLKKFTAREGEIIGLAGLDGAGQATFLRLTAGLNIPEQGKIKVHGKSVFLPADRLEEALFTGISLSDHFSLRDSDNSFWQKSKRNTKRAERGIKAFFIKGQAESTADDLSGGNQQRLLLALLDPASDLILLENPTRGLDIQSGGWVWDYLTHTLKSDTCILFSSPELDEILHYSDRILVFYDGEIVLDSATAETNHGQVAAAMTGMAQL